MKIVADDNIPYLKGRLEGQAEVVYCDQHGFTPELVRDADAIIIRTRTRVDERLLKGSSVRLVATATIGMDQIDCGWCATHGITVRNSPGCNAPGVAQYVWSALLRCGFNPATDTLGIVGCGNVGGIVYEWGRELGCNMLVSDPPRQRTEQAEGVESGIEYAPLSHVLAKSDAVTLHTPLTRTGVDATFHLIGAEELSQMRDGTLLVNAARGPVVDFAAMKPEVTCGRLRAVIDTWEGEPEVGTEILEAVKYGTFHIAGYSRQGKERATRMVLEAVREELGIAVDTQGLTGPYAGTPGLNAGRIVDSYDPGVDTAALRSAPSAFDLLRAEYHYREEV